jgi:hypothetical protein
MTFLWLDDSSLSASTTEGLLICKTVPLEILRSLKASSAIFPHAHILAAAETEPEVQVRRAEIGSCLTDPGISSPTPVAGGLRKDMKGHSDIVRNSTTGLGVSSQDRHVNTIQ